MRGCTRQRSGYPTDSLNVQPMIICTACLYSLSKVCLKDGLNTLSFQILSFPLAAVLAQLNRPSGCSTGCPVVILMVGAEHIHV